MTRECARHILFHSAFCYDVAMTAASTTREIDATTPSAQQPNDEHVLRIGQVMTRMRVMTGRRVIGRLAIQNVAPGLELSHLDVLEAIRRTEGVGEVTVGTVAETLRIDPSRASRIVAEMVSRGVLRRKASQADARRIVVVMTALGQRLLSEIRAQKLSVVERITADWPAEEVEAFARLFDRFVAGFEDAFPARDKETEA
jgi:DNA-binding MarR family transcriptional regulator